jgi:hypothetical protein
MTKSLSMEMFNWLMECVQEGSLTLNEMEKNLDNRIWLEELFDEFTKPFDIGWEDWTKIEVEDFIKFLKKVKKNDSNS